MGGAATFSNSVDFYIRYTTFKIGPIGPILKVGVIKKVLRNLLKTDFEKSRYVRSDIS
jgi:hypothetical protein